jgi:hypothetical protein
MARWCGSVVEKFEARPPSSVGDDPKVANSCTFDVGLSTPTLRSMLFVSSFTKASVSCDPWPGERSRGDAGLKDTPEAWHMRYKAVQIGYYFGRDTCFHLYCLHNFTDDYFSEQAKQEGSFFSLLSTSCTFLRTWLESLQEYGILNPSDCAVFNRCPPTLTVRSRATGLQPDDGVVVLFFWRSPSGSCWNVTERAKL